MLAGDLRMALENEEDVSSLNENDISGANVSTCQFTKKQRHI